MRAAKPAPHIGPVKSAVGGRTDLHPVDVPSESFVIPSDVVSGLGEGNTDNGQLLLSKMFSQTSEHGPTTPIMIAGGEHVIGPTAIKRIGNGDLKRGMGILREFVLHARKQIIKETSKLAGPHR